MVVNNRTTVAAKKQATEIAAKVITPVKKEKYVSFSRGGRMNKTFFLKEIVKLEQVADKNLILVTVTKMKEGKPTGGYLWDIHKHILKNDGVQALPKMLSEDYLNVRYGMYVFERESHEKNNKVETGVKFREVPSCKVVIPCVPNKRIYGDEEGNWHLEKIRDDFIKFLCLEGRKTPANSFVAWKAEEHNITKSEPRTLDMCLIDECVGDILEQYFLPEGYDRSKVYEYLKKRDMMSFFKKNKDTNEYSTFAKEVYHFP